MKGNEDGRSSGSHWADLYHYRSGNAVCLDYETGRVDGKATQEKGGEMKMKDKKQLVNELRECCREAADRLENDETHIRELRKEIHDLRSEINRLHHENFWLTNEKDGSG